MPSYAVILNSQCLNPEFAQKQVIDDLITILNNQKKKNESTTKSSFFLSSLISKLKNKKQTQSQQKQLQLYFLLITEKLQVISMRIVMRITILKIESMLTLCIFHLNKK